MDFSNPTPEQVFGIVFLIMIVLGILYGRFGLGGDDCPKCGRQRFAQHKECLEESAMHKHDSGRPMCIRGRRYKRCHICKYEETVGFFSEIDR